MRGIAVVLLLLGSAAVASAQQVPPRARLVADKLTDEQFTFFQSAAYADRLMPAIRQATSALLRDCKDLSPGVWDITFFEPLVLDRGRAVSGSWRERRVVTACGAKKLLNFFAVVDKGESINVVPGIAGTTIASLALQKDTIRYAFLGATQKIHDCKDLSVTDSHFDQDLPVPKTAPPIPRIKKVWRETWRVGACGHVLDVPITFIQGDEGTAITPDLQAVAERTPSAR